MNAYHYKRNGEACECLRFAVDLPVDNIIFSSMNIRDEGHVTPYITRAAHE